VIFIDKFGVAVNYTGAVTNGSIPTGQGEGIFGLGGNKGTYKGECNY
jgi:hypothetical protein